MPIAVRQLRTYSIELHLEHLRIAPWAMSYRMYLVRSLGTLCVATAGPPLHTGGSGSLTVRGQTYLSPRVLGFQVGDRRARRVVLGTYDVIGTCTLDEFRVTA